jgi:hypothetical protein
MMGASFLTGFVAGFAAFIPIIALWAWWYERGPPCRLD